MMNLLLILFIEVIEVISIEASQEISKAHAFQTTDLFATHSCRQDSVKVVLQAAGPFQTRKVSGLIGCAVSCGQDLFCSQAVFLSSSHTCNHVTTNSSTTPEYHRVDINSSSWQDDVSCTVLSKVKVTGDMNQVKDTVRLWQPLKTEHLAEINIIQIPVKVIETQNNHVRIRSVTHLSKVNIRGDVIVSLFSLDFSVLVLSKDIKTPLRQVVSYLCLSNETVTSKRFDNMGHFLAPTKFSEVSTVLQKNNIIGDGSTLNIAVADTFEEVRRGLLKGYKRVARQRARYEIDHITRDVHFDLTETFMINSSKEFGIEALFVTSVKESFNEPKRYLFRHQINNGTVGPETEEQSVHLWHMQTSWRLVEPVPGLETIADAIVRLMLEGRELRVVMGDTVSTDVVTIQSRENEIVAHLAKYLVPFRGIDSKGVRQRVRLPVLGGASQLLVECEKQFQGAVVYNFTKTVYPHSIKWFASTANWTTVMAINSNKEVTYGSHERVYNAAKDGYDIRLCSRSESSLVIKCYSTASITLAEWPFIVYRSSPWLDITTHSNGTLDTANGDCRQKMWVVGSDGWVKAASFIKGTTQEYVYTVRGFSFEWFAEFN